MDHLDPREDEILQTTLPWSQHDEQFALGLLLGHKWERYGQWLVGNLREDDFCHEAHAVVYRAAMACHRNGSRPSVLAVEQVLRERHELDKAGGAPYLKALVQVPHQSMVPPGEWYAEMGRCAHVLRDLTCRRNLARLGSNVQGAVGRGEKASTVLGNAQAALRGIMEDGQFGRRSSMASDIVDDLAARIEEERGRAWELHGPVTGIDELDNQIGGLGYQRLVVVRGKTGFGKTTFCGQTVMASATKHADHESGTFLVYVCEGPLAQFARNAIAWIAWVDAELLEVGGKAKSRDDQSRRIRDAYGTLRDLPIRMTDAVRHIDAIEADARCAALEGPVLGILIDHAQAIQGGHGDGRTHCLEDISKRLQDLADEVEAPILLPSQVTKDMTGQEGEKHARAIGENASLVVTVERGKPDMTDRERRTSPDVWIACDKSRVRRPFQTVHAVGDFATRRLHGDAAWAGLNQQARPLQGAPRHDDTDEEDPFPEGR